MAILALLKRASVWQLVAIALLALLAIQSVRIDGLSIRLPLLGRVGIVGLTDRLADAKKQRDEYRSTLDKLAKESADRQKQTEKVIADLVKRGNREAERVENAPLPGLCRTPSEVLQADL